jgi:hypothetical protein
MTKAELQDILLTALHSGNLVIPKHDPDQLHVTWPDARSILAKNLTENMDGFIRSGEFSASAFQNPQHPQTPQYWTLSPSPGSAFSVPGSGVPAYSPYPSSNFDRLVVISGYKTGVHMFAENSQVIEVRSGAGTLNYIGELA